MWVSGKPKSAHSRRVDTVQDEHNMFGFERISIECRDFPVLHPGQNYVTVLAADVFTATIDVAAWGGEDICTVV